MFKQLYNIIKVCFVEHKKAHYKEHKKANCIECKSKQINKVFGS